MKTVISVAMMLALMLSVAPVMAGETFEAFSNMTVGEQGILTPLNDEQLATVEGADVCAACINAAVVRQANIAVRSAAVAQANVSTVNQRNQ